MSFVLVIAIMVLAFAFFPEGIRGMQDWIEGLNDHLRTPPLLDDQGLILYRTLVNENTIFGIIMTLVSRAIIEVFAWGFGAIFGMHGQKDWDPIKETAPERPEADSAGPATNE